MKDIICFMREKEIFTVSEAAQYLTVCAQTVYKLMHTGQLRFIMIGSRYKIEASAIREYLENRKADNM